MFKPTGEWWAVKTKSGANWQGPSLVTLDGDNLAWDGGPSGFTISNWNHVKLIKQYENNHEYDSNEWWDRVEELRDQFERDFPPDKGLKVSGGWLSPEGNFYPCGYTEHLDMAYRLAVSLFDSHDGEKFLEDNGWAKVWYDGRIINFRNWELRDDYTQAQINTLGDLLVLARQEENRESYVENLAKELSRIREKEIR